MSDSKFIVVMCLEGGTNRSLCFLARSIADVRTYLANSPMFADLMPSKEFTVAYVKKTGFISSESIAKAIQALDGDDELLAFEVLRPVVTS